MRTAVVRSTMPAHLMRPAMRFDVPRGAALRIAWLAQSTAASIAAMLLIMAGDAARAADADVSAWDGDAHSAARVIAGARPADRGAALRAGIEIRLQAGWHTYWRYPGDAGVPPRFDFAGSRNLKAVEVRYPAPRRLPEADLDTIGYDRGVILP